MNTSTTTNIYNLIILDESGSMQSIYRPALTGLNETLQTIRAAQTENLDQNHLVTLVTFNSTRYYVIYRNTPAASTTDIQTEQYQPCACTPLFDTIGRSVNELRPTINEGDVVLVTIITDGYENDSREYNVDAIKALVEELRLKGWVFTYIGANQDVEKVAMSMSIKHHLAFNADEQGTNVMFETENTSRMNFYCAIQHRLHDLLDDELYF